MRSIALALVAAAACAGAEEARVPTIGAFREVRSIALVRSAAERDHRGKDPLDGLEETLRARGFATRLVELAPRGPPELAAVQRLFDDLERRATVSFAERSSRPLASAAEAVTRLAVDAVASYHRLRRRPELAPPATAGGIPPAPASAAAVPTGALVLVDRAGHVATFAWGEAGPLDDPAAPQNAAEAIDHLVRALTGEPPDE